VLRFWKSVKDSMQEFWSDMDLMPPVGSAKSTAKPGRSKFKYRLLEETGLRAFSKLASDLFRVNWIEGLKSPSWDALSQHLQNLAKQPRVREVLTKPKLDKTVLDIDPDLKSTGKAGVEAIYRHLKDQLDMVVAPK